MSAGMEDHETGVPLRPRLRAASFFLLGILILIVAQIAIQATLLRDQPAPPQQCPVPSPTTSIQSAFYRMDAAPASPAVASGASAADWSAFTGTFVQLGLSGVMLLLFIQGRIVSRSVVEGKDREIMALVDENKRLTDLVGERHLKVIDEKFIPLVQQMVSVSEQSTQSVTALKTAVEQLGARVESVEDKLPHAAARRGS